MNIEQVLIELSEPLLRLVSLIKPDSASDQPWLKYVEVKDVKLSVEYSSNNGYSVIITCEPALAIKATISDKFVMGKEVMSFGDPDDILQMVISAVSILENNREQKS